MKAIDAHRAERWRAFRLLYDDEWSDSAIARVTKTAMMTVAKWREREGLKPLYLAHNPKIDDAEARLMHAEGASDGEIARHFKVTQSGATRWRQRAGLEPNFDAPYSHGPDVRKRARKMLCRGAARIQVADEFGIHKETVARWRRKITNPGLRPQGLTTRCIRVQVLKDGTLQARIAKALGSSLPKEVKDEAVMSMYVDALDGRLLVGLIEREAPAYRSAAFAICGSNYGPRSLDEENEDGWSLLSTIEDPTALQAYEVIFED